MYVYSLLLSNYSLSSRIKLSAFATWGKNTSYYIIFLIRGYSTAKTSSHCIIVKEKNRVNQRHPTYERQNILDIYTHTQRQSDFNF